MRRTRGQSESVGVVLLTAVVVVSSVTVGAFLLANFDESGETEPTVDISSDVEGRTVVIEHRGGDSYQTSDVQVVLRQQASDDQHPLGNFSLTSGGDNETFAPGDRREKAIDGLSGEVQLLVVDEGEGELLHEASFTVEQDGIELTVDDARPVEGSQVGFTVTELLTSGSREVTSEAEIEIEDEGTVEPVDGEVLKANSPGETVVTAKYNGFSDSVEVSVLEPPTDLQVDDIDVGGPVTEGETLGVKVDLTNDGEGDTKNQEVTLLVNGTREDSKTKNISAGETGEVELSYETEVGATGKRNVTVVTEDDREGVSKTITIEEGEPDLQISEISPDGPVTEGDTLDVTVTLKNEGIGEASGESVELDIDGTDSKTKLASADPGESADVTFEIDTDEGDAPSIELTATTEDDPGGVTEDATIDKAPTFEVEIDDTNSPVTESEELTVDISVTNTGDVGGEATIELAQNVTDSGFEGVDEIQREVGASETEPFTLTWDTRDGDSGVGAVRVDTGDTSDVANVQIRVGGLTGVQIIDTNAPIEAGETLEVDVYLTGASRFVGADLVVNGEARDTDPDSIFDLPRETATLEWETGAEDIGQQSIQIETIIEEDSQTIQVREPVFEISDLEAADKVRTEELLTVSGSVENTGEVTDEQEIELRLGSDVDGDDYDTLATESITLNPGEETTVEFEGLDVSSVGTGDREIGLFSARDERVREITIADLAPVPGTTSTDGADLKFDLTADGVEMTAESVTINSKLGWIERYADEQPEIEIGSGENAGIADDDRTDYGYTIGETVNLTDDPDSTSRDHRTTTLNPETNATVRIRTFRGSDGERIEPEFKTVEAVGSGGDLTVDIETAKFGTFAYHFEVESLPAEANEGSGLYGDGDLVDTEAWDDSGNFDTGALPDEGEISDNIEGDLGLYTSGDVSGEALTADEIGGEFEMVTLGNVSVGEVELTQREGATGDLLVFVGGNLTISDFSIEGVSGDVHVFVGGTVDVGEIELEEIGGEVILYGGTDYGPLEAESDDRREVESFP